MVTLGIDVVEGYTKSELAQDLREIASRIEDGYAGGITCCCGTSWGIEGKEEYEDEDEEEYED